MSFNLIVNYLIYTFLIDVNSSLCLRTIGKCEHISDNHATITYDSVCIIYFLILMLLLFIKYLRDINNKYFKHLVSVNNFC